MNASDDRYELAIAKAAEAESDAQVRNLLDVLDRACDPESNIKPADAIKLVNAALALNARLKQRSKELAAHAKRSDFRQAFAEAASAQ